MQKCGYYPGIPGFFQVYPQNTRYFADFADFATKKALRPLALISVRQLVSAIPYHFLISAVWFLHLCKIGRLLPQSL